MRELSLHILDIAQNSLTAGATLVEILVDERISENILRIVIKDNGSGIKPEMLEVITDPFTTSRTTRKVGMGIPLFKNAAECTGGSFYINSRVDEGTEIGADFVYDNVDRQPIGDMAETMTLLVMGSPEIDFIYKHSIDGKQFEFKTSELKQILGGDVPLNNPEVVVWIKDYIKEGLNEIKVD